MNFIVDASLQTNGEELGKVLFFYVNKEKPHTKTDADAYITVKHIPTLQTEEYTISVSQKEVVIEVSSSKGANRALASLLAIIDDNGFLPECDIWDKPDMPYRSVMIDVARQIHPIEFLYRYIDLCWIYKLSYCQIHFTDDQGFALPVKAFPNLPSPGKAYTEEEISALNKYAKERGIELVPEMDIPGHTSPFMQKYPEVFGSSANSSEGLGDNPEIFASSSILPASEKVFKELKRLYDEIIELFPDSKYIHIGGDEAHVKDWETCPCTQKYMKDHGISSIGEMYTEYIRIITDHILSKGRTPIVWEGFPRGFNDKIDRRVIVISWENHYQSINELADAGFTVINCSWQPLYIVTPIKHWSPEYILNNWNIYNWQHWWDKSLASVEGGISRSPSDTNLIGAQICAWGDQLMTYEDYVKGAEEEYALVRERVPALSEQTWNVKIK